MNLTPARARQNRTTTSSRRRSRHDSARLHGQSLAEFAVILPLFLTLFGAAIDFARLYTTWVNLEAATRDAAEYVATCVSGGSNGGSTTGAMLIRCDGVGASTTALTQAKKVVCTELGYSATCSDPAVTVPTYTQDPSSAAGGTAAAPVVTVTVSSSTTFRTLLPYPLITNNGQTTISSSRLVKITQGK